MSKPNTGASIRRALAEQAKKAEQKAAATKTTSAKADTPKEQ